VGKFLEPSVQMEQASIMKAKADLARFSRCVRRRQIAAIDRCVMRFLETAAFAVDKPPSLDGPASELIQSRCRALAGAEAPLVRMLGRRAASMDLPDPGGPTMRDVGGRTCRPAIFQRAFGLCWPYDIEKSRAFGDPFHLAGLGGARSGRHRCSDARRLGREIAPITWVWVTHAAPPSIWLGKEAVRSRGWPVRAAGNAPITGISVPSGQLAQSHKCFQRLRLDDGEGWP